MKNRHVLLIEDNLELQTLICNFLKDYNYTCSAYSQPLEALKEFETNHLKYAIIILDLGLPRMDGFDLFKKLKEIKNSPIIISTARDDIGNKIYGFELGADDYLSKPYEPRELVLRIDATLKRYTNDDILEIDELLIDVNNKRAFLEEQEIEFTKIESEIFFMFIKNINKVFIDIEELTSKLLQREKLNFATINASSFKVSSLILDSLSKLSIDDESKIELDIKDDFIINADMYYLTLALKNLIDNAMKYAQEYPIKIETNERSLEIKNMAEKLSNDLVYYVRPFTREPNQQQGHGLGLNIVNKITQMHGFKLHYSYKTPYNIFSIKF